MAARYGIRALGERDHEAVLEFINADRLPGQPVATPAMLAEALAGRSPVDSGWWAELTDLRTDVAVGETGDLAGVVSYAVRPRDGAGVILWLHANEVPIVVAELLDHVVKQVRGRSIEAFAFATALTVGLEALPVSHRQVTHQVLLSCGFRDHDLWRYMHRRLPASGLPQTAAYTVDEDEGGRQRLTLRENEAVVAEATIGLPSPEIGVVWWLEVNPAARGRGFGASLLGSALALLSRLGAQHVILYVDDDEPGGDRDRTAANRLYERSGFNQVDRLHSYRRQR